MDHDYVVRPFESDDLTAFLSLYEQTFSGGSERWFRWKYVDNPYIDHVPIITAEDTATDTPVGFRPHMAVGLQTKSRTATALQPCDTMVHPEHRRQGLFTRMTTTAIKRYEDEPVDLFFNFPNEQSRPGNLKLGWEVVGEMSTETRIRSPKSWAELSPSPLATLVGTAANPLMGLYLRVVDSIPTPSDDASTVSVVDGVPADRLAQLAGNRSTPRLTLDRSAEFFEWRYSRPDFDYRTYFARRDSQPITGLVTTTAETAPITTTTIVDAVSTNHTHPDQCHWYDLVREVTKRSESDSIRLFGGSVPRVVTRRLGFFSSESFPLSVLENPPTLVAYPLTEDSRFSEIDLMDRRDWNITWAAWDVV